MSVDKRAKELKHQIWFLMLEAEKKHLYYGQSAERYRMLSRIIDFGLIFATVAAAGTVVGGPIVTDIWSALLSSVASIIGFLFIAGLTIYEIMFQNSRNAGVAEVASRQARDIASETKKLYRKINSVDSVDDLTERADVLQRLLDGVTSVDLPFDLEFDESAYESAVEQLMIEFPGTKPATVPRQDCVRQNTAPES